MSSALLRSTLHVLWTLLLVGPSLGGDSNEPRPGVDWPQFRGIGASGLSSGHALPTTWNLETGENVLWKTPVPGLAHASPVVWGDHVFVATGVPRGLEPELLVGLYGAGDSADDMVEHDFQVWCLDRRTGDVRWVRTAERHEPLFARHTKATHVNSTPASDGSRVVTLFGSQGLLVAHDFEGQELWQVDLGELDVGPWNSLDLEWGYASSPILVDGKVVVQADVKEDPYLAAFDAATGEELWRVTRDDVPGWATPTAYRSRESGDWRVLVNGCKHMGGYDLATGAELWRMAGGGGIPVPAPVVAGEHFFYTSNHRPIEPTHPQKPIFVLRDDVAGELAIPGRGDDESHLAWWKNGRGSYMQTPLVVDGRAYFGATNGVLGCYDALTGDEHFRERLGDGKTGFTASAVAGDGKLYCTSEEGTIHVIRLGAEFERLASNAMGEICMATPAIAQGMLLVRTQGHLVAVGERADSKADAR